MKDSTKERIKTLTNGLIKENPLLVLNIGLCSSLGVTTSIFNGLGMGVGMTFVLVMSEIVISLFRKLIPSAIRLPVFIIIIAAFTTIVQLVLQAYVESLYDALGVFLPLIVVNCIIMGRVEAFASKHKIGDSILDAIGMGVGYTIVLVVISFIRELLGGGTLMAGTPLKIDVIPEAYRMGIFNSAPGGFIVFGCLAATVVAVNNYKTNKARRLAQEAKEAEELRIAAEEKAKEEEKARKIAAAKELAAKKKAELEAQKAKESETTETENSTEEKKDDTKGEVTND